MERYRVDLSGIDVSKREEIYHLLDSHSHFAECVINGNSLEAVIVNWASPEDFESSPVFPKGCQCTRISDRDFAFSIYIYSIIDF